MSPDTDAPHSPDASIRPADNDKMARRAAASSFFGSVIEYYDFLIYGTAAALVFGPLFFPASNPAVGTLAALATFGVAYLARPAGAVIFGHFGDRVGRKKVLTVTVLLMGGSSTLIGVLPTYDMLGYLAPALLVLCRLLQGLSAGGEQVGASLLTMEHASDAKKTLYSSWAPNGAVVGSALATLVFIPVAALPDDDLMTWGWRIPFLLSAITVAFTIYLRHGVDESPEFVQAQALESPTAATQKKVPVVTVFTEHPKALLCVFVCAFLQSVSSFVTIFGISFAKHVGFENTTPILLAIALSQFAALIFIPIWATLADRLGQKKMFVTGAILCAVGVFGFLAAIQSGNLILAMAAPILLKGVIYSAPYAIWPVFYGRQFSPEIRYTGIGIAMQTSYLLMGFTPAICVSLLSDGATGWLTVAILMSGLCLAAAAAGAVSKDAPRPRSIAAVDGEQSSDGTTPIHPESVPARHSS
ncbi:MFS transporter [Rhodococcus koreensis]